MIHADRSTRSVLYRLQISTVDKLKCYVSLFITVAVHLLLLCNFSFTSNVDMLQHEKAGVENLDDSEARKLRDYKPYITPVLMVIVVRSTKVLVKTTERMHTGTFCFLLHLVQVITIMSKSSIDPPYS